ncbi:MAG: SpoIID/LytB domain-containing protein [Chlamydiales bacterium]
MIKWLLLLLVLSPFGSSLQGGVWDDIVDKFYGQSVPQPPNIRVLVEHDVEKIKVDVTGKYSLYDPYTNSHISSRFVGKSRDIQARGDGLKWGEAFPGLYQLKITPDDAAVWTIVDGQEYTGSVFIYDIGGTLSVVNQLPVEDYVRYLLVNFPDRSLHSEVLAAVAIVARTNAYYQASNPKNTFWAVDASKVGYQGKYPVPKEIAKAVNATRYMIMSKTGIYEGMATPFAGQFENMPLGSTAKDAAISKISLAEANAMAEKGEHAAQILGKAFPNSSIMLMHYAQ